MTTAHDSIEERKSGSGCLKAAGIGCALLFGGLILVIVVIVFKFDSIKDSEWVKEKLESVESAKTEVRNMLDLREGLLLDYPADEINIQANIKSGDGASTRTLTLRFVNPEFELSEDRAEREVAAREIAMVVAERFPDLDKYDSVSIAFDSRTGIVSDSEQHTFDVSELTESAGGEEAP